VAFERITVNAEQMGGLPCIRGLPGDGQCRRRPARRRSHVDQILEDYPYLRRDDIFAALEYAAAVVNERELPTPAA